MIKRAFYGIGRRDISEVDVQAGESLLPIGYQRREGRLLRNAECTPPTLRFVQNAEDVLRRKDFVIAGVG